MITIKDIAKKTGVAVSTVSYVLNNDARITEETRIKVLSAARELGYAGRSGKKKNANARKIVILCLHTVEGFIIPEIVRSLVEILKNSNCDLLIYLGEDIENFRGLDGLIVLNSKVSNEKIAEMSKRRIPIVLMDRNVDIPDTARVILDNYNGMYGLVRRVVERGARSFVFIGGPHSSFESGDRYAGFAQALSDGNVPGRNALYIHSDFTRKGGMKTMRYLLSSSTKMPDAIICANDEMAAGVISVLRAEGYKLPQDVTVTGFDGNTSQSSVYPGYMTVNADHKEWANNAAFSMIRQLKTYGSGKSLITPVEIIEI